MVLALGDMGWMQTNARLVATRERVAAKLAERGFRVTPSAANCGVAAGRTPPPTSLAQLRV